MLLLLAAVPVGAEVLELPAIQDAHINDLNPNQNFGNDIDMYVGRGLAIGTARAHIKFDLSGIQGKIECLFPCDWMVGQHLAESRNGLGG